MKTRTIILLALVMAFVGNPHALAESGRPQRLSSNVVPQGLNASDWVNIRQQAYLKASNTEAIDGIFAVAVSGDTVVVGAFGEDSSATGVNGDQSDNSAQNSGAVYVFVRSGTNWSQQAYLKASNTGAGDLFGDFAVAVSGDTIVVGAFLEDSNATGVNGDDSDDTAPDAGAAYVFVRDGRNWTQQAYLKASNTTAGDQFGVSVAVSGDTIAAAANREDSNATGVNGDGSNNSASDSGAAYVFARGGTMWTQQAYLKASNTEAGDQFGFSVAVSGNTIVVGTPFENGAATGVNGDQSDNSVTDSGAAYVFARDGTTWTQHAYLKASNTGTIDQFGVAVAISGDTVVIGANREDSGGIGVNGDQMDNGGADSGAAYVFARDGTTWRQEAYLKASNTGTTDQFGRSVAVLGNTVVVGALREDSGATGVNGNQSDNSVSDSGAAYVFVRSGTNWIWQGYLKASNTGATNQFGNAVAVLADSVVVGAVADDSDVTDSGAVYVFGLDIRPALALVPEGSGGYLIRFNAIPGWTYELQRATSANAAWSTIDTSTAPASGVVRFHDINPPNGQAFYRVALP